MNSNADIRSKWNDAIDSLLELGRDGQVYSAGTVRTYKQAIMRALEWDRNNGGDGLATISRERAIAYLAERAERVAQKTLDMDWEALQILQGLSDIPRVRSSVGGKSYRRRSRSYTDVQIAMVAAAQGAANSLATMIAAAAGLRAHELLTLRGFDERPESAHITWLPERFVGLRNAIRYTVIGTGGIIRTVAVPLALAERLEAVRLPDARQVIDRSVHYETQYDIRGGLAWSQSYSSAAKRVLGWSTGAQGLRDTYAETRMEQIFSLGYEYDYVLAIIRQEMGNWSPQVLHKARISVPTQAIDVEPAGDEAIA